jgi:hypothetical protein
MYVKYAWKSGSTAANVLADLVLLLTAQVPDINALSTDCDKYITTVSANTVKSNWTVHDPAAGADSRVLRSLNADGVTYKYAQVCVTAENIDIFACENFNATTHVAVNGLRAPYFFASYSLNISFTNPGYVQLMVSDRYIGVFNSPLVNNNKTFVFEYARTSPNIDSSYPCIAQFTNQSSLGLTSTKAEESYINACRYKDPSKASGDLVTTGTSVSHLM